MNRKTRLGWVRHGTTEWNRLGKIQGVTDIPMNLQGLAQAQLLADRLANDGERWDGVVSSDLLRAVQTGETLASRLGLPLIQDSRLRERSFGSAEGTTEAERIARWGTEWRKNVPDQEDDERLRVRGLSFVDEWMTVHAGESWLVVSHGSFLGRMLQELGAKLTDRHLLNMSLTVTELEEDGWNTLVHNCTVHLN